MTDLIYFDTSHAIDTHNKIIEISGGKLGTRDMGLIDSVLAHVRNDDYYPTFYEKLTHIVYSIIMNHAFDDGNKRSSIALGGFFLTINGYEKRVGVFILEMENIVLWVARKKIDKKFLLIIITSLVQYGEIQEEVKLRLLEALSSRVSKLL